MSSSMIQRLVLRPFKTCPRQTLHLLQLKSDRILVPRSHNLLNYYLHIRLLHPNLMQSIRKTQLLNKDMQPSNRISISKRQSPSNDPQSVRNGRGIVSERSRQNNSVSLGMREIERATNRVAHFVMQSHLRAPEAHGTQPRAVLGCSPSAQRLWGLLDLQQGAGKVTDAFRCVVLDQGVGFFGVQTFDCG